jgi:hypothetical protein
VVPTPLAITAFVFEGAPDRTRNNDPVITVALPFASKEIAGVPVAPGVVAIIDTCAIVLNVTDGIEFAT